jgi:ketosteroid isomerase-like protein
MPKQTDTKSIASDCLSAWSSGDLETTRSLLADEVTFTGPLGSTRGADAYIEGIKGMVKIVERTVQHEVFAEGDDVCIIYDLVTKTPRASIPTAGWYKVRDGKITSVRAFFDPRPLMPADAGRKS